MRNIEAGKIIDFLAVIKEKQKAVQHKADTERERELAMVFQISSIPQVLYIPVEGKPMLLKGLYPKENIVEIIEEFLLGNKKD